MTVLQDGESIIISDFEAPLEVNQDRKGRTTKLDPGLCPAHAGIRSALVVPIAFQGQVAGLIHLHAKAPHHFGDSEREIVEALAIQAAIALGNANRYQEQLMRGELLNRRVETLSKLLEVSQALQTEQPLEDSLEVIAEAIQAATPFDVVLISLYDLRSKNLVRVTGAGIPPGTMSELRARPQTLGQPSKIAKLGISPGANLLYSV